MIRVEQVTKSYEKEKVLKGINLNIPTGSVYGLIGPNGSGKTTLLNLIAGVFKTDSGDIFIDGNSVYENIEAKKKMVYITENPFFFNAKTVKELAVFYSNMYKKFDTQLYKQLLTLFELDEKKPIQSFSKGMKKQAIFIVSIAIQPEILLMDELIDGIDPIKRRIIWTVLMNEVANKETTILIASHNIKELESICSDIGIIQKGICVLEENVESLREHENMSMEEIVISKMGGMSDDVKAFIYQ